jgi:hypothetical protein
LCGLERESGGQELFKRWRVEGQRVLKWEAT